MRKKYAYISVPLVAVAIIAAGVTTAFAHGEFGNLTDEEKETMEEIRELHQQGLHEEVHALAEEAGLPPKHGRRHGRQPQEVKDAIANNDYEAFLEATAEAPFAGEVDEETFALMTEAHALHEAGDHEAAREIMDELDIFPRGPGFGQHQHNQKQINE